LRGGLMADKTYEVKKVGRLASTLVGGAAGFAVGLSFALLYGTIIFFAMVFGSMFGPSGGAGGMLAGLGIAGIMLVVIFALYLSIFTLLGMVAGAGTSLIYNYVIAKFRPMKLTLEEI